MNKILLIDVDSKIPNIALMKIAKYHRGLGDDVGFSIADPDKIYASVVFRKNAHRIDGLRVFYPNAKIDVGGGGYSLNKVLPSEIESQSPDYSIYPGCDSYYGFTTRGCIRHCYFCIVSRKEGSFRRVYRTGREALDNIVGDAQFDKITFLDNNILADKEWFFEVTDEVIRRGLKVDFNQGLDVRLLDKEIAGRLTELHPYKPWKFAFDDIRVKDDVLRGIDILRDAGIDTKHKVMFYVYCHDDAHVQDAVTRCNLLKDHHTTAYSMCNADRPLSENMKKLKRWTRPQIFWTINYEDYDGRIQA